ncbi:myb/SANT-like DNA-binding domain-containing protein 2 [Prorops nasuta]|uniref:myb/SANT-like DNA-binding domain-containing protein 2 n=1 Tax=Prorops nasuta TaxID=863751 RepID=UPI0034CFB828
MAAPMVELSLLDVSTNITYTIEVTKEDQLKAQCGEGILTDVPCDIINDKNETAGPLEDIVEPSEISENNENSAINIKNVKKCWETVSAKLQEKGYNIAPVKCNIKMQALKRRYKLIKDYNNKSGNNRKEWNYFEMLDAIFNKRPWTEPLSVAGSNIENETNSDNTENEEDQNKNIPNRGRKRKSGMTINKFLEESLNEKRLRRKLNETQHKEKMDTLKNVENLLAQYLKQG